MCYTIYAIQNIYRIQEITNTADYIIKGRDSMKWTLKLSFLELPVAESLNKKMKVQIHWSYLRLSNLLDSLRKEFQMFYFKHTLTPN